MKGLIFNCKSIAWGSPGLGATSQEIPDCLLVLFCCEENDASKELKRTIRRIRQLNLKRFNRNALILFPFAHLSNKILDKKRAHVLIKNAESLLSKDFETIVLPFDKKKEIVIHLLERNKDVSFLSY